MTEQITEHKKGGLGELPSTAISGNNTTSSCLYVSALAIVYAGVLAPIVLLVVSGLLYLFRSIYAEVVGALPLNGGAYNALLNTTSKFRASVAACLTILSYMATAVISAGEAMHYAQHLWRNLPVIEATVIVLGLFMVLSIFGIQDSAKVATVIFLIHIGTLSLLMIVGGSYLATHGFDVLLANLRTPPQMSLGNALLFGFAAALLGISGFESSANYVEEQAEGVFPKTLRNMWIAVTVFNPGMAVLALSVVPLGVVEQNQETLLAHMGLLVGGPWLPLWISVDAVLVLSGAVLTSFVGVNGLVRRMTLDRCLPQFLLKTNRRKTTHWIFIGFFILCTSVLMITGGGLKALAGVYTISFLGVMALFAIGNILLKVKRAGLPRPVHTSWLSVIIALIAVIVGLVGSAVMNPTYLRVFLQYFIPTVLIVSVVLGRIKLLKFALFIIRGVIAYFVKRANTISSVIRHKIDQINAQESVFFTRGDNVSKLNTAMVYVSKNEETKKVKIVTIVKDPSEVPDRLPKDIKFLDEVYPDIVIDFVVVKGKFGPELIQELSEKWNIPTNFMFIGSPTGHLIYGLAELGGVRLII